MSGRISDSLVSQMYDDYLLPMTIADVGRKWNRSGSTIRGLFKLRGLDMRPTMSGIAKRLPTGRFAPVTPLTTKQVDELIESAKKICIPNILRVEWRRWSMDRRRDFISRLRAKLNSPKDRPVTPFSDNVVPFDYFTPAAREIAQRENVGRDSQSNKIKIRLCSQGVIFENQLWFWAYKMGYKSQMRRPGTPYAVLHSYIWQQLHGAVPPKHVVIFLDGNPNNFNPKNLDIRSRDYICRENQAAGLMSKSRAKTAILLNLNQQNSNHDTIKKINSFRR